MYSDLSLLDLVCLDTLSWLGNGIKASEALHLSPSSVSRRSRGCAAELGIKVKKHAGHVALEDGQDAVKAMRLFLGQLRRLGKLPLRLETYVDQLAYLEQDDNAEVPMHLVYQKESEEGFLDALNKVDLGIIDCALMPRSAKSEEILNQAATRDLTISTFYNPEPIGPLLLVSKRSWSSSQVAEKLGKWLTHELQSPRCRLPDPAPSS